MTTPALLSAPEADERLSKASNWARTAVFSPLAAILVLFLHGHLPVGLVLFLSGMFFLMCIVSLAVGLGERARHGGGWIVHVEGEGLVIHPSLANVRALYISLVIGMACGPVALVIELALRDSLAGIIGTVIVGFFFSAASFVYIRVLPHRPTLIHRGPIIRVCPDHVEFQPLLDDSPTRIPWDSRPTIEGFSQVTLNYVPYIFMHVSVEGADRDMVLDMTGTPIPFAWLTRIINYFNDNPDRRDALGLREGASIVRAILTAA